MKRLNIVMTAVCGAFFLAGAPFLSEAGTNHSPVSGLGTALQFNGVDKYVQIADAADLDMTNNYTLECWFKADSFGGLRGLIDKYQSNGSAGWLLRLTGTDLDIDQMTTTGLNLQTGTWYHVTAVNSNGTRHLYLNGVEKTLSGSALTVQANNDPVRLGSDYSDRYFAGKLDEARIWKQALSGAVVSNWMYREVDLTHPAFSNLVGYFKLNDGTGLAAADSAGAHTATLVNMSGSEWTNSTIGLVYNVTAGRSVSGLLPGSDQDGSSSNGANWMVSFEIVNSGTYGTATVLSANAFTYSVPAMEGVVDQFTYRVRDASNAVSSVATVTVSVASAPSNHPPVAGFGTALTFDGVDDHVSLPTALATAVGGKEAITIEYWFKGSQLRSPVRFQNGGGWIVAGWGATGPQHIISADGGTAGVSVGDESIVENGQWHHLAMTWQRNTVNGFKSYLDGTLVAQRDSADVALPNLSDATPYLGCISGNNEFLAGSLDEVRIWNQALSGTVISNWTYRSVDLTHPAFSSLVAYYKLDDGTGLTATDSTGAYPGSLQNMSGSEWTNSTVGLIYAVAAGQSVSGYLPGSDQDGASSNGADWALSFEIVNQPAHGTVAVMSANSFSYPSPLNAGPVESFTYRVRDSSSATSGISTVTISVALPPPSVDITNTAATVAYAVMNYSLGGTNNPFVVGTMWWTNDLTGASSTFAATNPWAVSGIPLAVGTNLITVFGTNASGASASDSVAITRSPPPPTTRYVWTNSPSPAAPYTNWTTAAHTIQAAVNAAYGGDTVLVTNGTYASGGVVTPGYTLTNRVCITNAITVQSVNGPSVTFIVGAVDPATNGPAAIRCVYMTAGSTLGGFTLTNGHTLVEGDFAYDRSGGGVFDDGGGVISNCCVLGCSAESNGGGINNNSGALTVNNCLFAANLAGNVGGGVYAYGTVNMNNCTINGNSASDGGGVYGNGGMTLYNCIVFGNVSMGEGGENYSSVNFESSCTTPDPEGGTGNIIADPQFFGHGDYRLRSGSPCVDMGNNAYASGSSDLLGKARIVNGAVDMGAYEFQRLLVITNPAAGGKTVFGEVTTYTLSGTNAPGIVGMMKWTNSATGSNGTLAAVSSWTIANMSLAWGTNAIVVSGTNASGAVSDDSVQILRSTIFGGVSPIHYVWTNSPSSAWPYTNWVTAAHTIQVAVDVADSNETVLVTNGVYNTGGAVRPGYSLSNRVYVTRPVTLLSVNGPSKTIIVGAADPVSTNGPAAVRCVFMATASVLSGFTLTNGHTLASSANYYYDGCGGGAFLNGCTVSNCFVSDNSASHDGGGIYVDYNGLNLSRSLISRNNVDDGTGSGDGGGVYCDGGMLAVDNCLLTANQAAGYGGAIYAYNDLSVSDSTISGNSANYDGGIYGGYDATLTNSIVFGNAANDHPNYDIEYPTFDHCCTTPDPGGDGNVIADPLFIGSGNYRLRSSSPCVDAGTNDSVVGGTDLDGNTRIVHAIVDMGAFEFQRLLVITNPAAGFSTSHQTVAYTVSGTNAASIVGAITWTNRLNGTNGTLAAALNWTIASIPLMVGDNTIVITGTNSAGAAAFDAVTIQRTMADSGNSPVHYTWPGSPASIWPYTNWATAAHVIQDAVDSAMAGDTVLVTNGVYVAGGAVTPGYSMTNRVCIAKAITVRSINGPASTMIVGASDPAGYYGSGPASVRCVYLGSNVVVSGFTLTNGYTAGNGDWIHDENGGGALLDFGGTLTNCVLVGNSAYDSGGGVVCNYGGTLNNCAFNSNSASYGGGAYCNYGGILNNCAFNSNSASYGGGAYCNYGGTLNSCTFLSNSANYGGGVYFDYGGTMTNGTLIGNSASSSGGGVMCNYGGMLDNCAFSNNSAGYGGGAFCGNGGTLNNCTLSGNSANGNGGGAYCQSGGGTLNHCTLDGNSANEGAGVYLAWGGALSNCLLNGNSANNRGGGVNCTSGGTLDNCTVAGNFAGYGGGVYCLDGGTLKNTIIYGNIAAISDSNVCINGSGMVVSYSCTTPDPGGTGNITNDPQFVDAPASNFHLQVFSPCINTGTNQDWMLGARDLDGNPRLIGGRVDMGAYESTSGSTLNGIRWAWLLKYGLETDGSADQQQSDTDAVNNLQEYIADTDPTNPASYFCVTAVSNLPQWTVCFQSSTGRLYTLNGISNLVSGVWTNIPGAGPRPGTGGPDTLRDTNVPPKGPFYRLKVELP